MFESKRVRRILSLALSITGALGLAATSSADVGYAESRGHLLRVDLETGDGVVIAELQDETRGFEALTFGPDDQLYAIATILPEYAFYIIDPDLGTETQLSIFDLDVNPNTLAFGAEGRLFMAAGDRLYEMDLATGLPMLRHTLEREVLGMASRDDEMYGVTGDYGTLERLDPESGTLQPIFDLDLPGVVTAASFDPQGRLRLATLGGGILSQISLRYSVVDIDQQTVVTTFSDGYHFTELEAGVRGLAMRRGVTVEVPTLGTAATLLLFVTLAAAGVSSLRRRRST